MARLNYQDAMRNHPGIVLLRVVAWTLAVVPFIGRQRGAPANSVRQNHCHRCTGDASDAVY
ncbi:MAG TPA: hypothetical protein VIG44_08570 [Thermomicrobiales bacterium]